MVNICAHRERGRERENQHVVWKETDNNTITTHFFSLAGSVRAPLLPFSYPPPFFSCSFSCSCSCFFSCSSLFLSSLLLFLYLSVQNALFSHLKGEAKGSPMDSYWVLSAQLLVYGESLRGIYVLIGHNFTGIRRDHEKSSQRRRIRKLPSKSARV